MIVPKARICGRSMVRERKVRKTAGNSTDGTSYKSARMLKYDGSNRQY